MANLELSSLIAVANGAAGAAGAAGTVVGADASTVASPSSFSQLLQSDVMQNLAVAPAGTGLVDVHGGGAGEPAVGGQTVPRSGSVTTEPVGIGKAGAEPQAAISVLATGTVLMAGELGASELVTGEGKGGEVGELVAGTAGTAGSDADAPEEEEVAEMIWLGLPLCMESRAASRKIGSSEDGRSPSSPVTASVDPTLEAIRARSILRSALSPARSSAGDGRSMLPAGDSTDRVPVDVDSDAVLTTTAVVVQPTASVKSTELPQTAAGLNFQIEDITPTISASAQIAPVPSSALAGVEAVALVATARQMDAPETGNVTIDLPASRATARLITVVEQTARTASRVETPGSGQPLVVSANTLSVSAVMASAEGESAAYRVNGVVDPRLPPAPNGQPLANALSVSAAVASAEGESVANRAKIAADSRLPSGPNEQAFPLRPGFAEPFAQAQPVLEGDDSTSTVMTPGSERQTVVATGTAAAGSNRLALSASQDLSSFVAAAVQVRQPSIAAPSSVEVPPPDASGNALAGRAVAVEATVSAGGGTAIPASTFSASPMHLDRETSPASPATTPDILDLHQKNWGQTLGRQLNWMVNNRLQEAEIRVNPPDLGPIEVRVSLHQNQTSVTFFCHEAAVREAIENTLPRLRDLLDGQGITLNQAQVSDQSLARQQAGSGEQSLYGQRSSGWSAPASNRDAVVDSIEAQPRSRRPLGVVDHYV